MPQPGGLAPALAALDANGAARRLDDLAGPRGLVLLFYRGAW